MRNDQQHFVCWNVRAFERTRLRIWTRKNLANKMELYQQKKKKLCIQCTLRVISCHTDKVIKYNLDMVCIEKSCAKKLTICNKRIHKKKMGRWPQWMTITLESIWKLMMFLWIFVRFISTWMQFSKYHTWFLHPSIANWMWDFLYVNSNRHTASISKLIIFSMILSLEKIMQFIFKTWANQRIVSEENHHIYMHVHGIHWE